MGARATRRPPRAADRGARRAPRLGPALPTARWPRFHAWPAPWSSKWPQPPERFAAAARKMLAGLAVRNGRAGLSTSAAASRPPPGRGPYARAVTGAIGVARGLRGPRGWWEARARGSWPKRSTLAATVTAGQAPAPIAGAASSWMAGDQPAPRDALRMADGRGAGGKHDPAAGPAAPSPARCAATSTSLHPAGGPAGAGPRATPFVVRGRRRPISRPQVHAVRRTCAPAGRRARRRALAAGQPARETVEDLVACDLGADVPQPTP